jgi:hypothetical protein
MRETTRSAYACIIVTFPDTGREETLMCSSNTVTSERFGWDPFSWIWAVICLLNRASSATYMFLRNVGIRLQEYMVSQPEDQS